MTVPWPLIGKQWSIANKNGPSRLLAGSTRRSCSTPSKPSSCIGAASSLEHHHHARIGIDSRARIRCSTRRVCIPSSRRRGEAHHGSVSELGRRREHSTYLGFQLCRYHRSVYAIVRSMRSRLDIARSCAFVCAGTLSSVAVRVASGSRSTLFSTTTSESIKMFPITKHYPSICHSVSNLIASNRIE